MHEKIMFVRSKGDVGSGAGEWGGGEFCKFRFEVCTKQTGLEGAVLEIERIPAVGKCKTCGEDFDSLTHGFSCPKCGGSDWEDDFREGLIIKGLEVI